MGIYVALAIFLFVMTFFRPQKSLYLLIFIILLALGGLRGVEVGTDTSSYYEKYQVVTSLEAFDYVFAVIEPSWILLNLISFYLFDSYQGILWIGMFLVLTPVFIRVWKSCHNPYVGILFYVLLFFYFNAYNITRQMIAVSFVFYALPFIESRSWKKYYLFVLIAVTFHHTSMICLLFPLFLQYLRLSKFSVCALLPITYFLGIVLIPSLISSVPFLGKYSVYLVDDANASGSITRSLLNVFFIFIYISSKPYNIYMKMLFIGILFYNLFAFSAVLGRCAIYFMIAQLILFCNIQSKFKYNVYIQRTAMLLYAVCYYIVLLSANSNEIVPYELWK